MDHSAAFEHSPVLERAPKIKKQKASVELKLVYPGEAFPKEYVDLRRQVYVEECRLVDQPFDANDETLSHLLVYENGELVASVTFGAAEDSDFAHWSNASPEKLKSSVFGTRATVRPSHRGKGYYRFVNYALCSYYRRQGRSRMVAYSEQGDTAAKKVLLPNAIPGSSLRPAGSYGVECIEADINFVMWKMFDGMAEEMREVVIEKIVPEEIEFYAREKVKQFYKSPFYNGVMNKTLSKQQYLEVQANTYCYVQWTTRILAGLLGNITDEHVFKEISHHLVEEIGHPQMILNDMRACGVTEDYLDYVVNGMIANPKIDAFMTTQESAVAFRTDPIAFMGVPIAIEGIAAFMPKTFAHKLRELASEWGVKEPNKATTFWASHLIFDNPDNGHWARMIDLVRDNVRTEQQVRQILNYIDNVLDNVTAGYSCTLAGIYS